MFTDIPKVGAAPSTGRDMLAMIERLFPICRSITGNGVRETLRAISEITPLEIHEVPTGTAAFDWTVPKEWNIRDAWIKAPDGKKIADFSKSNLHVVGYSVPVKTRLSLAELRKHLHSLPERPDWIPYRTSYYKETWGFCLPHRVVESLSEGEYEVCIDSRLENGNLTYAEHLVRGSERGEVLISTHICHPSLADDNLSGNVVAAFLARMLRDISPRYSYRFLFIPGTIGSITWLARNDALAREVRHGLVLSCLGDSGAPTYKRSRQGDAAVDHAVQHALESRGASHRILDFSPYGYDERQFNSPGFNLPVGCLMRSMYGTFPEYHTSADNVAFMRPDSLADSLELLLDVVDILENNRTFRNLNPCCEPQLGRRGLYDSLGGRNDAAQAQMALLWVLNLSDSQHSLLDIARRARLPFRIVREAAAALVEARLLAKPESPSTGKPA